MPPSLRLLSFDHAFLGSVANRIINEEHGINRVTYDITSKPPGTMEWDRFAPDPA